jgi:hypothetical protein
LFLTCLSLPFARIIFTSVGDTTTQACQCSHC